MLAEAGSCSYSSWQNEPCEPEPQLWQDMSYGKSNSSSLKNVVVLLCRVLWHAQSAVCGASTCDFMIVTSAHRLRPRLEVTDVLAALIYVASRPRPILPTLPFRVDWAAGPQTGYYIVRGSCNL